MNQSSTPFTVTTSNVSMAISQAAVKFRIPREKVSCDIEKVTTTIKDMKKRTSRNVEILTNEDLINPNFLFSQKYNLMIREKESEKNDFPKIIFANNMSYTSAYLIIKKKQDLKLSAFSKTLFISYLEYVLLENKCLIRINQANVLAKAVDDMYENYEVGEFTTEDIKITAIEFPDAINPIPDSLEMTYKKKNKDNGNDNKEFTNKKKENLASTKKDSVVIEYKKIVEGVPGRRCDGKLITVNTIKPTHIPSFNIDSKTIRKEETNTSIKYIAQEAGFVFFENKLLRIDNKTEMTTANIRNKDKLVTSLDDGVSVNIKSKDKMSDAVGGNIDIKSDKVNIGGNVGPSATIEGNIVKIGGQTHSKSTIKGKKVLIAKHKGEVRGIDVKIETLEGGSVIAKNAHIEIARGGKIEGENIIIDNLESNVEVTASQSIKVKSMIGESNTFILKPLSGSFMDTKDVSLEDLIEKKDLIDETIKKLRKKLKEKMFLIEFNEESLNIQRSDKIDKLRYDIKTSVSMDNKLRSYVKLHDDKDIIEHDIEKQEQERDIIDKKIQSIYSDTENAFMTLESPWTSGNSVYVHYDGKASSFYPTKDMMKSPISYDILKQQHLI